MRHESRETTNLEGHGRIPELLIILHQRALYAGLCYKSAEPLRLRGSEHKVANREQRAKRTKEKNKIVNGEMRARARHSRLKLTDVIQQRLRRIFPLSLHALSDSHEQARGPLRKTEALMLVGLDIL